MERLFGEWIINDALQNPHPMHYAARKGDIGMLKSLIARGYVVNCSDNHQNTPLHEAASLGHTEAVQFLLDEGAWRDAPSMNGNTPLAAACQAGRTECAQLLLMHNVSINPSKILVLLTSKSSPLHQAALTGSASCIKLLIENGAEVNLIDLRQGSPLQVACLASSVNLNCITLLLQAGADINVSIIHSTPLHIAVRRNLLHLTRLLLNYGADFSLRDDSGRRPKELANQTRSPVWKLLHSYEVEPRSLQYCSRLTIVRSLVLGKSVDNVTKIGLPRKIVEYILKGDFK